MRKKVVLGMLIVCVLAAFSLAGCSEKPETAGQYSYSQLEQLEVCAEREFDFASDLDGWKAATAGGTSDTAALVAAGKTGLCGIKLAGSDQAADTAANAWIYNKFALTASDKVLYINVVSGNGADADLRVRVLQLSGGEIISDNLSASQYSVAIDEDGYYTVDNRAGSKFTYDISAYAGKTVIISIEQNDSGDGSDETLYISEIAIQNEYDVISTFAEWDTDLIALDWNLYGSIISSADGLSLKSQASFENGLRVSDSAPYFKITFNKTEMDGVSPKVEVYIDGEKVTALRELFDYVTADTAEFVTFCYDLSPYVDQEIMIEVKNTAGTACFSGIMLDSSKNVLSKRTSWDQQQISSEWDKSGDVEVHTEGVCLQNHGKKASISNIVSITDKTRYLKISFRKFVRTSGVQDANPKISVYVDEVLVKAIGAARDYVTATTDEYESFFYNLAAYDGENVLVKIVNIEGQHACFNAISLEASATAGSDDDVEQYTADGIEALSVSAAREFKFESDLSGWTAGTSGLEYDFAGWSEAGRNGNPCAMLDGSDLGNTANAAPNAWIYNKFTLGAGDKYLYINMTGAARADANVRVRLIYVENGELVSNILTSDAYEKALDKNGYYLLDSGSGSKFIYDISMYSGKTAVISIEQDDSGEGAGEIVHIYEVSISADNLLLSTQTQWDASEIVAEWDMSGNVEVHTEGACLENYGEPASISILVSVTAGKPHLNLSFRKFVRDDIQDKDPKIELYANGNLIRAVGAAKDYVTAIDDNFVTFGYDLSEYAGENVLVKIVNIEGEHACFNSVAFVAAE